MGVATVRPPELVRRWNRYIKQAAVEMDAKVTNQSGTQPEEPIENGDARPVVARRPNKTPVAKPEVRPVRQVPVVDGPTVMAPTKPLQAVLAVRVMPA